MTQLIFEILKVPLISARRELLKSALRIVTRPPQGAGILLVAWILFSTTYLVFLATDVTRIKKSISLRLLEPAVREGLLERVEILV